MLTVGLLLLCWDVFLLFLIFFRAFTMKAFCQRPSLHLLRSSWDFCPEMIVYIYWIVYVESSLWFLNEIVLILVSDLFDVFLNLACKCFIGHLCNQALMKLIYPSLSLFLLLCLFLYLVLGVKVILALWKEFDSILFFWFLWISSGTLIFKTSLKLW